VKKIHEAWRTYRVLSLVSFDVQGAYPSVLANRWRERRIPGDLVAWVESFCNGRKASVVVGDYESPISEIEHVGIPQGSPLLPILYVFYNENLVQGRISTSEGSIGFIDDYNAWVIGPSAAENTRKLQTQLLPRAEKWTRESGAVFEAEKTTFIHFVRPLQPDRVPSNHLIFGNKTIAPKRSAKILGVTMDSGLSMNEHVSKAIEKATGKCMALRKIRSVRPAQMRQMYMAAVVPTTDYAASTWYAPSHIGVKRHVVALERVQRLAARSVLRAYRSVAMLVLQSEAKLQSVSERLHERVSNHTTKLCSLAPDHPSVVPDKLKQQPFATEQRSGRLSSSPPLDWDSPSARRSIRKAVNESADRKTKKLLSKLTDELLSTKAQLTLAKLEKKKALDALRAVQKKQKRGKKLMEEFRASEDCGAVVFSPSKVRKLLDLQKAREQAEEQRKVDKALKTQQTVAAKELKVRELQQRKCDRAAASAARKKAVADVKAARKVAKEALRAQGRREKDSKAANRRPRVMTAQQKVVKKSAAPTR
jgi:hypothetical protein